MAGLLSFFEDLFQSIFTPGPTTSLIKATNISFLALQLLLTLLLYATKSIHFVVLSLLCGGLWWSINWFVTELESAKKIEKEADRLRSVRREKERQRRSLSGSGSGSALLASMTGGTTTEAEGDDEGGDDTETTEMEQSLANIRDEEKSEEKSPLLGVPAPTEEDESLRKRRSLGSFTATSTEDEWEKVDQKPSQ
jgi:hypothetical protein